ncbi:MAG: bifunctional oligoribonuclease/PAP phosphatase NrnA [Bacteroidaceae bacterium]|nr:bifunctional oligoribonuclease/PAP phosphatase NrnA [Bacteroidaceae bacterium]
MIEIEKASEIKRLVEKSDRFAILVHRNPDGDAVGSSLALAHFLRGMGKIADVIVPNAFPDFLKWLPASDSVVNFEQKKEEAVELLNKADIIFCLDFNALSRIGEIADIVSPLSTPRILVDHHLYPEDGFVVALSNTAACSTAELVYNLVDYLGDGALPSRYIAECLYTGIMTDTGNFAYASNRKEIYIVVARLIEAGIDKDLIYRRVFYNYSIDRLRLFGYVMNHKLSYYPQSNATLITLTYNEMRRFNAIKGDTEGLVNMPLQIKGVRFSCFLREEQPGKINVSLRSVDDFPCNSVAADFFSGGGHKNASGGEVQGTMEEAVERFNRAIEKYADELVK